MKAGISLFCLPMTPQGLEQHLLMADAPKT